MKRIPEPELMLDEDQVTAYANVDFDEAHGRFLQLLSEKLHVPSIGRAVDLGCGSGDITLRFARAFSGWMVDAVDGSSPKTSVP